LSFGVRAGILREGSSLVRSQAAQIRSGGPGTVAQKGKTLLLILLAVPAVVLIRALRPLLLVRFRSIRSKTIGHLAINPELYLCERDLGIADSRTFDIFYMPQPVSNRQLEKMWRRVLRVSRFANELLRVSRWFPWHEHHAIPKPWDQDSHGLLARAPVHLSFTAEEESLGRANLEGIGLPEGAPFVCFHSRDAAYVNTTYRGKYGDIHDYRDSAIRSFGPAAEELAHRGYFAIRMGAVVEEPLNTSHAMVIDYATRHRTDFLDIFLLAKCSFFLGGTAGIYTISAVFRRPLASVNWIPLGMAPISGRRDLFIPKKLWLRKERRFMTFREIFETRIKGFPAPTIGFLSESRHYEQLGIEAIENTPEEITALAVEMDERLKGVWQASEEDEELQRRFWPLFKGRYSDVKILTRIGTDFLRQNRELLD